MHPEGVLFIVGFFATVLTALVSLGPIGRAFADRLREWIIELDAAKWDEEFEEDAATGKLDPIAEEAIAEFHSGRFTAL